MKEHKGKLKKPDDTGRDDTISAAYSGVSKCFNNLVMVVVGLFLFQQDGLSSAVIHSSMVINQANPMLPTPQEPRLPRLVRKLSILMTLVTFHSTL